MPSQADAKKIILLLASIALVQHQEIDTLDDMLRQLYAFVLLLGSTCASMNQMPEYRRLFGTMHLHNEGQVDVVKRMMQEHPRQFYEIFRMQPETFKWLKEKLWGQVQSGSPPDCARGRKPDANLFENRLLYTIYFLASGCSYRQLSFTWGKTLDWRDLLIGELATLKDVAVRWPEPNSSVMLDVCQGFEDLRGFKGCCGCIDGTFVKIRAPLLDSANVGDYNTYKKFYAIQVLAICIANKMFTYVHAGTPGSRSDAWIIRQTKLWRHWDQFFPSANSHNNYSPMYYLFGDSGFKLLPWLMIPFSRRQERETTNAGHRKQRKLYSADQKSTRACIENAFGILKCRWHCLRDGLQCRLNHASTTVWACIVLHNICIAQGDIWSEYDPKTDRDEDEGLQAPPWLIVHNNSPPAPNLDMRKSQVERNAKAVRERLVLMPRANRRRAASA